MMKHHRIQEGINILEHKVVFKYRIVFLLQPEMEQWTYSQIRLSPTLDTVRAAAKDLAVVPKEVTLSVDKYYHGSPVL